MTGSARHDEVAAGLSGVEQRIADACVAAGRSRDEVTLVVVTKLFPDSDVRVLADLGVRHVGENRYQEAVAEQEACRHLELTWHFLGRLQSNKAAAVGGWADVVHSVDRIKLVAPLAKGARQTLEGHPPGHEPRPLGVLVQVNLDRDAAAATGRGGIPPADAVPLAEAVMDAPALRLLGVMAVAPRDEDPREAFARLADAARAVRAVEPTARWVSAGMSGDLEAAIACGATHVRVGGAILGNRPTHR